MPLNRILLRRAVKNLKANSKRPTAKNIWLKARETKPRLKYTTVKTLLSKMAGKQLSREKKDIPMKPVKVYVYEPK